MSRKTSKSMRVEDPRIAISKHIAWSKPTAYITDYALPEPDNFNYAVMGDKPIECKFLEYQVLYKKPVENKWWSVFFVPSEQRDIFLAWLELQEFDIYWSANRSTMFRDRRPMLWAPKNKPELTDNERLFSMGYYSKLHNKYFSEDDKTLLERLGPARAEIWDDLSQ